MKSPSYKLKGFNMSDLKEKEDGKETLLSVVIPLTSSLLIALKEIVSYVYQVSFSYKFFVIVTFVESILLVLLLFSFSFIIIRLYSFVTKNREKCYVISSIIFSAIYFIILYTASISIFMYLTFFYLIDASIFGILFILLALLLGGITFVYVHNSKEESRRHIIIFLALLGFVLWGLTFSVFMDYKPLAIDIEIDELYEIDNQLIPISIKINGYNNALSVEMYQENSSHDLNFIDKNIMFTDFTDKKVEHGKYIFGNYLNNGNYIVFVNTTGLESGYYELCFNVYKTSKTVSKGFYLVDENPI